MMYVYQLSQLQEELRRKCVAYQSSSEENLQLQHSMQNQHTMLQESTSRIAQLEESQSQLQSQVQTPGFPWPWKTQKYLGIFDVVQAQFFSDALI